MQFAKKSLGQNFLTDQNILKKIISLKNITNKEILEIGPGKGALTKYILSQKPKSLIVIEKDNLFAKELLFKFKKEKNIKVFNKDVLKFNFEKIIKKNTIIFGNLPYNISSQILIKLIKSQVWPPKFTDLILMFQKEMAQRIIGKFGTKDYGRLSILSNYRLKYKEKFNVSPNCFFPKPKINSTVLHLQPKNRKNEIRKIENLEKITSIFFSQRRKMIKKSINKIFKKKSSDLFYNLDLKLRPENLTPDQYYDITKEYESN